MAKSAVASVVAALVASLVAACTIGGPTYETVTIPLKTQDQNLVCGSPYIVPDLSTLPACGNGQGHCYASNKVSLPELPACPTAGDVCVPDPVLKSNGQPLKACTFFIGNKPGACVSTMIAQIGQHQDELKQDVCADDERCGPCISPEDGSDTHLCDDMGVHPDVCEAGAATAALPPCCHNAGVCMNETAVPSGSQGSLQQEACTSGKVCAPADLVDGQPTKCSVLGVDGVCLDLCFAAMLKGAAVVTRGSCGPTEMCLPCVIGGPEGMPGC